ncbi:bifunctional anthranilate synthase component II/anthranilate phosphoribosyltransferase [Helicobacter mustelae]|uniref:Anthranilate phosphoribosyltransferase n=1 Tax=Helicobacter mustelae (strain ATCC 43772 / CCUG 25715 / CIP 103759 / LMG 18044 / NCTC 12198 / R85-136P) TaxID=679897 RepID=D3UGQ1_HELM1|nr:bifunctional anthranilate synthase component II/anthranilate phosphoribosyltransferase [Helicobacter mustelae]CBG39672.1 anthranilate synthase component II; anthranilate phosphoribosyltransferase [Helicobacter mustelae 12198]SQH71178.1 anthranilate phosphoribosyltransferase [Helicobacter mustelae]STP12305.1 anthranilate phosphoribosyltransferase [Helicobacter mustelae]
MLLLIDNYDSFTYNIYQAFCMLHQKVLVVRSDKITCEQIQELNPSHIIIGPGPKTPKEAGISMEVIQKFYKKIPILGICLGHQAIMASFGMPIVQAKNILHGKIQPLSHKSRGLFRGIPQNTLITRYHSLVGRECDLPECLEITAKSSDGEIMAIEHKEYPLIGVQFHPESIGSTDGLKMFSNFLHYKREETPILILLKKALQQQNFSFQEAYDMMDEITEGNLSEGQIASLLTSLEIKGLNAQELAGFSSLLRNKSLEFPKPKRGEKRLDIVGTGGSMHKTFNVSTISSIILASMGVNVLKHGNRAATSQCGSADLLEALGVNIQMSPEICIHCYEKLHFTFLFAQKFHYTLKKLATIRKELGFKTLFNLIGPLINPSCNTHQILGVFDPKYTEVLAQTLQILGIQRALVVSGMDGYDEISLTTPTQITELHGKDQKTYLFTPQSLGLEYVDYAELKGGDVQKNRQIAWEILRAEPSPRLDLVCMNAGAALYIYGEADSIKDGYLRIKEHLKTQKPKKTLEAFQKLSHQGR